MIWIALVWLASASDDIRRSADHWADHYGVERELVYAVIEAESAWDARAISKAGAVGAMQLMPDTAALFGVSNRFEIEENIRGGVAYLAWLRARWRGDLRLTVASYIAGPNRVAAVGLGGAYSREVSGYVRRVALLYRRNRWEAVLSQGGTPK